MTTVAVFSTPAEAHLAVARLRASGVDALIRDEFTVTCDWFMSNAIGGVKIQVRDDEVADALAVLNEARVDEGVIRCPHCDSADIRVRVLSAGGAILALIKLPLPLKRATVDCRRCGKVHKVRIDGRR